MRALTHIGLAVALIVAPALCCCKTRGLSAAVQASPSASRLPAQAPPVDSCCVKVKSSCCQLHIPEDKPKQPDPQPAKPAPAESRACCAERPAAAQIESKPTVAAAEPTGEVLPLAVGAPAYTPEHAGWFSGTHPPDRAGVDARSAALFERHNLRC